MTEATAATSPGTGTEPMRWRSSGTLQELLGLYRRYLITADERGAKIAQLLGEAQASAEEAEKVQARIGTVRAELARLEKDYERLISQANNARTAAGDWENARQDAIARLADLRDLFARAGIDPDALLQQETGDITGPQPTQVISDSTGTEVGQL